MSIEPELRRRLADWDQRTTSLLETAYLAAGSGPGGSGSSSPAAGDWRAKRQHLAGPMDADGDWLDVGCANGHLLATLPSWAAERGLTIRAHGLELIPALAERARALHPELADRIWTGSVLTWDPPRRFRYVTALTETVPDDLVGLLAERLLDRLVEDGGRLILSSYTDGDARPRPLVDDLAAAGWIPDGVIRIERPGRHPLQTVWFDRT